MVRSGCQRQSQQCGRPEISHFLAKIGGDHGHSVLREFREAKNHHISGGQTTFWARFRNSTDFPGQQPPYFQFLELDRYCKCKECYGVRKARRPAER